MLLFKLAEEVIAFVVHQQKGGQTFDFHHPDGFHSQFGVFEAAQVFSHTVAPAGPLRRRYCRG
ncbi:Uncharacterised protein [Salmonella enterica subsp. arizonae]|uniref:Uncharacterized protein n=1 Tax=Salmonella enterica subsp. arizonae TaxID=59203 RepID=A0A2X4TGH1_SALER|nr:Uncharacterised protein [Salmonella enterica subsp. arizonae]